jgi:hypothetical protein
MAGAFSQNTLGAKAFFPSITDNGNTVTIIPTASIILNAINTNISGSNLLVDTNEFNTVNTLIAFFNASLQLQQPAPINPTGGVIIDSESRTAINDLITILNNYGLTI